MNFKLAIILAFSIFFNVSLYSQSDTYVVTRTTFSSDRYDEFSPSYYNNGLVFCTNRNPNQIKKYTDSQNKGFFKIFYIDTTANVNWVDAKLFSKRLTSKLNDGPATFSANGVTVYFSRNIIADGKVSEISSQRNTLGIFYSTFDGLSWRDPREFRFNNEWHNITTPCLSPDGMKLFFSSDMAGGFGGSDIYYCKWEKDYWSNPINLGPVINTSGNEAYPFFTSNQMLFFSSDGHPGLGGKDIFVSKFADSLWFAPVHLDQPVNSEYNDFGLITDPVVRNGYFSSDRGGTLDIYSFTTIFPQMFFCEQQRKNIFCYQFKDDDGIEFDPANMQYVWDFGDSNESDGAAVAHCFSGPGHFKIEEFIIDRWTGRKIFTKQIADLEIKKIEQPYISGSEFTAVGDEIKFSGLESNLPGYEIRNYFWDFGDGSKAVGSEVSHIYKSSGIFSVKLGLTLKKLLNGDMTQASVFKEVKVVNDLSEVSSSLSSDNIIDNIPEVTDYDHAFINYKYRSATELAGNAIFEVQLFTSDVRANTIGDKYRNVNARYYIKEIFLPESGVYKYIISEGKSFVSSYIILKDAISLGFRDARIQTRTLKLPEEEELFNLQDVYGTCSDDLFGKFGSRLTSHGIEFLDQIAALLTKYPECRLLIESHTDRAGKSNLNLQLSYQRAQTITNYLTGKGINYNRLVPRAYGDLRPMASDSSEIERKKNQRIDLMLIK